MVSFPELVRTRYLETIRNTKPANSRWKILVVDAFTKQHLNHVLKVYDILEEGVQQIDQLEQNRARNPSMEALYIVLPTTDNIERICSDFYTAPPPQVNKRDKNPPPPPQPQPHRYAAAHLCFVGSLSDPLFERVTSGIAEEELRGVKELFINFWAQESHVFLLKSPSAFRKFYAAPERSAKEAVDMSEDELRFTCSSIVNALAVLGEYPMIRYHKPTTRPIGVGVAYGHHITQRLAEMVQDAMDRYCRDNEDFPPKPDPPRSRGVLFITDRSIDLFAPLLHEFTYQAMINDLLDVEEGGTRYKHSFRNAAGALEEKEVILSEEDEIWTETRHMHMKDASDKLVADFQKYAGEYEQKFGGENKSSINDMKDMLASLDSTRKSKDSLSAHLSLAQKCMAYFEKHKLPVVADVEQCCATGLTPEGKAPRTLVEDMVPLLGDRALSSKDKVRIIALYILYRDGVPEEDRKRLFQHAHLALHEQDMINNLKFLGLDISKELKTSRKAVLKQRQLEDVYDISRFQPVLKLMLDDHIADRLSQSDFPYVRDAPPSSSARSSTGSNLSGNAPGSLRSARPQWAEKAKTKAVKEPRQRIIVFQMGGMTYSEIRSAYKVTASTNNREVFIGSSHIITPTDFLKDLADLDRGGAATMSNVAPDNARYDKYQAMIKHDRGPRLTEQEGFDARFPFVSTSRPSADRAQSAQQIPTLQNSQGAQGMPPAGGSRPGMQHAATAAGYQGGNPQQHLHQQQMQMQGIGAHQPGSMPVPKMPNMNRQNSLSRMGDRLLHPSANRPSAQQAVSYDANFNPVGGSPMGSRAPSIAASVASSTGGGQGSEAEKKKKKNFLKKAFK